ncbi:MAG: hypothetical protein WA842_10020, partial [Croceibacterium sp.]
MARYPLAAILLASASAASAQQTDWPTYGHDRGGQRHSPLTRITPGNVDTLQPAWVYHMKPDTPAAVADAAAEAARRATEAAGPFRPSAGGFIGSQATPLVIGGRMYLTTPYGTAVALDAATGRELWSTRIPGPGQPSLRGVEYWAGDGTAPPR